VEQMPKAALASKIKARKRFLCICLPPISKVTN